MKRSQSCLWAAALVILVGTAVHGGVRIAEVLRKAAAEAVCRREIWQDTAALEGIFFREEQILWDDHVKFYPWAVEGKRTGGGDILGVVYDKDEAMRFRETAARLRWEARELEAAAAAGDPATRQQGLHRSLRALSTALSRGEMGKTLSSGRILSYYLFGDNEGETGAAQRRAAEALSTAEASLLPAEKSGIFSARTDGWESFPVSELSGISPEGLARLLQQDPPDAEAPGFGRIVTGNRWYYAALCGEDDAARIGAQTTVTLLLPEGDRLTGAVLSVSPAKKGRCAAVFSGNTGLDRVLYRRRSPAEVLFSETEGLTVPASALREDETGPYVLRAAQDTAVRADVEILQQREDTALVRSSGLRENSRILLPTGP